MKENNKHFQVAHVLAKSSTLLLLSTRNYPLKDKAGILLLFIGTSVQYDIVAVLCDSAHTWLMRKVHLFILNRTLKLSFPPSTNII